MRRKAVDPSVPPSGTGCVECDAAGGWWFHLRRCAACGHIGCCDESPGRHASAHWRETGHRLIRSFEGEADGVTTDQLVDALLEAIPPRPVAVEAALVEARKR